MSLEVQKCKTKKFQWHIIDKTGDIIWLQVKKLTFVLVQLSDLEGITYRAMMGEYIIYYRGKIAGGIYDDRLLAKPVKSAVSLMPSVIYEAPYEGAKDMLLVDEVDDKEFLTRLFNSMYDEFPHKRRNRSFNKRKTAVQLKLCRRFWQKASR